MRFICLISVATSGVTTAFNIAFLPARLTPPKLKCVTSPLFTKRTDRCIHFPSHHPYNLALSSSNNDDDDGNDPKDAEIVEKTTSGGSGGTTSMTKPPKPLLQRFDDFGMSLKPRAYSSRETARVQTERSKRFLYSARACAYLFLFIAYRGYRGFFVLLPAVFREVFRKLKGAVDTPFNDGGEDGKVGSGGGGDGNVGTTIVVSILAGILTLSYVVTGGLKVLMMFLRTVTRTKSVETAFENAADEMLTNEEKIKSVSNPSKLNGA
mmetsp:Transcript_16883/g.21070  ORF Transcript_16883/g.21070 Transcript_16883/m.21070 type:complete len:266 (+) Transcript_16883:48-845(+)|eukprot:CAMPEP_0172500994 /NCGR_PEP_ID=MMETSP1066-20121228/144997_1 /TAXON_ID=671091 /ORGANISM="Coscinodiscus wailesii, Strain CCMP2513" /LENGTH=265 /DNA_ID=CAMNT_0013275545 /DNA_START=48 /DNA_END=845 /DNA_ORIENTATION=-